MGFQPISYPARGQAPKIYATRLKTRTAAAAHCTLYLVCSRLDAGWDEITTTYQKRWHVEVFHKSLKSNAAFAKSPAYKPKTQANHLFASIVSVFKMEKLKISTGLNHFSLKAKLYMKAIKSAFEGLQMIRVA